jgi:hypothetical protein
MQGWLAFLGGLSLANLLLVLLLARRVRQLARRRPDPAPWLAPGSAVKDFEATTTAGDRVSLTRMRGKQGVVAFFAAGCSACAEQVPLFARYAMAQRTADDSGSRFVLAVIVGTAEECAGYQETLEGAVMVVREDRRGPVTEAFAARAFPGIYLVGPGGTVITRGPSVAAVTASAAAHKFLTGSWRA